MEAAAQQGGLIQQEIGFVLLLTIAALVAILTRRVRLPYTVALVVVGLLLSFVPNFLALDVSSDLILAVLVPPLVFTAIVASIANLCISADRQNGTHLRCSAAGRHRYHLAGNGFLYRQLLPRSRFPWPH